MMGIFRPTLAAVSRVVLFAGLFGASEALAQSAVITGRVTNEGGVPIVGANLGLLNTVSYTHLTLPTKRIV